MMTRYYNYIIYIYYSCAFGVAGWIDGELFVPIAIMKASFFTANLISAHELMESIFWQIALFSFSSFLFPLSLLITIYLSPIDCYNGVQSQLFSLPSFFFYLSLHIFPGYSTGIIIKEQKDRQEYIDDFYAAHPGAPRPLARLSTCSAQGTHILNNLY